MSKNATNNRRAAAPVIQGVVVTIDAAAPEFRGRPIWCAYGPECFPSMFCCKILDHPTCGLAIWGYSRWRGKPGFRTLRQSLSEWTKKNGAIFFAEQVQALQFLANLTTPEKGL